MAKKKNESEVDTSKPTIIRKSNRITRLGNIYQNNNQIRIMMKILEAIQPDLERYSKGSTIQQLDLFEPSPFESLVITLPFKSLTGFSQNYNDIETALYAMQEVFIKLDDQGGKLRSGLISDVYITNENESYRKTARIRINKEVAHLLMDLTYGYSKIDPSIPFKTKSLYTSLMYILLCRWADQEVFVMPYKDFREYLKLEEKYKAFKDVKVNVIDRAMKELKEISDISFEFLKPKKQGNTITHVKFKILSKKQSEQKLLEFQKKKDQIIYLLRAHFKCEEKHLEKIKGILNANEYSVLTKLLSVIVEVDGYLNDGKVKEIFSKPDYVIGAILKAFSVNI